MRLSLPSMPSMTQIPAMSRFRSAGLRAAKWVADAWSPSSRARVTLPRPFAPKSLRCSSSDRVVSSDASRVVERGSASRKAPGAIWPKRRGQGQRVSRKAEPTLLTSAARVSPPVEARSASMIMRRQASAVMSPPSPAVCYQDPYRECGGLSHDLELRRYAACGAGRLIRARSPNAGPSCARPSHAGAGARRRSEPGRPGPQGGRRPPCR